MNVICHINNYGVGSEIVGNVFSFFQWILRQPNVSVYMGCVGEDKYSKILEDKVRSDGVNVQYQYTDKEPTG